MKLTFLTMPLETRLQIYNYLQPGRFVVSDPPNLDEFSTNSNLEVDGDGEWQLLDVCCQVRFEAAPIFFRSMHLRHLFQMRLPYARRSYYQACTKEVIVDLGNMDSQTFIGFWLGDRTRVRQLRTCKFVSERVLRNFNGDPQEKVRVLFSLLKRFKRYDPYHMNLPSQCKAKYVVFMVIPQSVAEQATHGVGVEDKISRVEVGLHMLVKHQSLTHAEIRIRRRQSNQRSKLAWSATSDKSRD